MSAGDSLIKGKDQEIAEAVRGLPVSMLLRMEDALDKNAGEMAHDVMVFDHGPARRQMEEQITYQRVLSRLLGEVRWEKENAWSSA